MRLFRTRTHVALWLGVVVAAVGVVLVLAAPPSSYGWFVTAPESDFSYVAGVRPWQLIVGPALVLLGAVVAAFAAGRLSAQRRH